MILAPVRVTEAKFLEVSDLPQDFSILGYQLPRSTHRGSNEVKSQISAKNDVSQDFYDLGKHRFSGNGQKCFDMT